jgi:Protein of unknown function (DUF2934)
MPTPRHSKETTAPPNKDPAGRAKAAATQIEPAADDGPEGARRRRIAERAYARAERRGFAPGRELDDWLAAEAEEDDGEVAEEDR